MHSPVGALHLIAALTALPAGAVTVLAPKGGGLHRMLGIVYAFSMLLLCISALMLYNLTGHFGLFHVFAILALFYTLAGLASAVLRFKGWLAWHVQWMTWSYLSLLAAALNEALIRLPLHLNTVPLIFGVGVGSAILIVGVWIVLRPRLNRAIAARGN